MERSGKEHEELMALLDQVPGVRDYMQSLSVQLGKAILERRIALGLSQAELTEAVQRQGGNMTQETVSQAESGASSVSADAYQQLLAALGGIKDLQIEYGKLPQTTEAARRKT